MIEAGASLPVARVWTGVGRADAVSLETLAGDGPFLLFFYLFDWSGT
jgi:hypothetical protein